jgi:DNA-binding FadR family transcriptional regulator
LRRPSLNETIRGYVKQYILDQGLAAGDPLPPETQLAQELGVGRGSVREAIKALQSLGIIEVRHGDGLYVRPFNLDPITETLGYGMRFDANTLSELVQIRIWLEKGAMEEVVEHVSPELIERLEQVMQAWQERVAGGDMHRLDLDEEFHRILYSSLGNQTFMKLFEVFWIAYEKLNNPIIQDLKQANADYRNHRAILDAVKDRDTLRAWQAVIQHFGHLRERIRRATKPGEA